MTRVMSSPQDEQIKAEANKKTQTPPHAADRAAASVSDTSEPEASEKDQSKKSCCVENLPEGNLWRENHDGSSYNFSTTNLPPKAELRHRFGSNLKTPLRKNSDDVSQDYEEDHFVACPDLTSRSSRRLQGLEQTLLSLGSRCHVLRETAGCLRGHVKGLSSSGEAEFYHHAQAAAFSRHYVQLRHLLEQRAQLLFLHEYGRRFRAAKCFMSRLGQVLERARLLGAGRDQSLEGNNWNLGLQVMSEELQVHLGHWDVLCGRARSDPMLRRTLLSRAEMLGSMRAALRSLGLQTSLLMEKCIHTQLSALAAAPMAGVPRDALEDLTSAVEHYNRALANQSAQRRAATWGLQILLSSDPPQIRSGFSRKKVRPAPLSVVEILRILARRRAQIVAEQLYDWTLQQADLLPLVSHTSPHWDDPLVEPNSDLNTPQNQACSSSSLPFESFSKRDREEILEKFLPAIASSTDLLAPHIPKKLPSDRTGAMGAHRATEVQQGLGNKHSGGKAVLDSSKLDACVQLFSQYNDMLWKEFSRAAIEHFRYQPRLNPWNYQTLFYLVRHLKHVCKEELFSTECTEALNRFCIFILSTAAFMRWDEIMCKSLGLGLKDKCVPRPALEPSSIRTSTMELTLQLFPPLLSVFQLLQTSPPHSGSTESKTFSFYHLGLLHRAQATVQSSTFWVMTKAFQFLASWSLNKFLLVTQGDLKVLRGAVESLCQQVKGVDRGAECPVITQFELQLTGAASHLQAFSELVLRIFSTDCKKMSGEIFEQTMPSAKHWRINYRPELPSSPSDYASYAAQTVIGQVLEGVQALPDEARIQALAEALTAFMEAWMEHILKRKIKFSILGALQLKQDFDLIRELIRSEKYSLSDEIHHQLSSLRVFHQVDSAIVCLLQQPVSKPYMPSQRWEPFRHCCPNRAQVVDQGVGSLNNLETMDIQAVCHQALTRAEGSVSTAPPESYLAMAQQEWLDLRIRSGSRWRIPGLRCFTKSEP